MPREHRDGEKGVSTTGGGDSAGDKHHDKKPRKFNSHFRGGNRGGRYYGKNRYHGGGDNRRHYYKKPRYDVGERLKEVDLGITEYVGNAEGFNGTMKERFTDFVVHEISSNGEIAQLNNQDIPPEPEDLENLEDLKKKIPEGVWDQLQTLADKSESVEIDVTDMDKAQRRAVHVIVKKITEVTSETKEIGSKKVMVFSKPYPNKFGTRQTDNRKDWSVRGGDYCHFVLHKVNMDTMDALNQMAKVLRVKSGIFNYAGTKDRRAKTTQWISVKKMNPKSIMHAARVVKGAFVGNFKFEKEPLKLGKLEGNRFTIALRNVTVADDVVEKAMTSLRDHGYINYYGLQRFGTIATIPTHVIGKALLQGKFEEAIDLILKPRDGEQDYNLVEARKIYQEKKDARLAYQKIGRNDKIEAKLLWGINIHGMNNPQGALDMVPRNTILMYIHSYQSYVWNLIVSKRIKEFGLKPVVGDLVYENPDSKDDVETVAEEQQTTEESTKAETNENSDNAEVKKEDSPVEEKTKTTEKNESENELPKVKVLTEADLSSYTIFDVVMPQPGWKVTYPSYAKAWFDEHLEKDGLTTDLKQKNKKYTLSGSYRKIVQKPENLSWNLLRYANKIDDLLISDIDELKDIKAPVDNPEGKFKALVIQMSLKPSSYATMALREVLKRDTSSQTHAAQSAAFHAAHAEDSDGTPHVETLKLDSTEDESNDKPTSEESGVEDSKLNGKLETLKEDPINDSGIDSGTVISA
ncbi:pseudouridylate synthase 7 homolog [Trichogramma pretiosum]|uniref:pseudouridylate synthase 7 homolog n=1 Tax=Trichogramma pretiosum TaxID=7493 RepID=UPI0006C9728F|nr:pseudouridylate synthase 7 homolog [Trichogramma pretiosum]